LHGVQSLLKLLTKIEMEIWYTFAENTVRIVRVLY
jgi:hypothetical protein